MGSITDALYELAGRPESVVELLDSSPFDELVEIDVINNEMRNLNHVEGKYFVPVFDGSYQDLYRYCNDYMVHPEDRHIHVELMDFTNIMERLAASRTPGMISAEFRYRLQNDDWRWVRQVVVGGTNMGLPEGIVRFYVFDIQSRKDRELGMTPGSLIRRKGTVDPLTGLSREREFFANAREFVEERGQDRDSWCLAVMDIDQFKLFNDWYGRQAGDMVLAKIGGYLAGRESRDGWLAGYLGQDDFCTLLPNDEDAINQLYSDVSGVIADYGASMSFTPIIGICALSAADAILDILDHAKFALDMAKGDYKHPVRTFDLEMYQQIQAEYRLLSDFEQALANHEIYFVLQPQCRVSNGKIVGVEALARWRKQSGEIVQPDVFVPVLEKFGFITDLDRYIWEDVCNHLSCWKGSKHDIVPVSVNVSKQDIYALDVPAHFEGLTRKYGLSPSAIKVEITESAYMDDTHKIDDTIRRLQEKGFLVVMDDFGSGYSSLNSLDSLSVDVIKLDMQFLRMNESEKRKGIRIIESIVNMAKTLNLLVITEGVETAEQADFMHTIGCRYVQGYYFYKPMSSDEFEQLIGDGEIIERQGFALKSNDEFRIREFLDSNVYSDAMLNNILGAVALYSWEGEDVSITRYNEQFYEAVDIDNIDNRLLGIQNYVDGKDLGSFWNLFRTAMADELNGSTDLIRFQKPDGSAADMLMHLYFLGEEGGARRFYGSVRNLTQLTEMRDEMNLMSKVANLSVVFLRKHRDGWRFTVGVHGLGKYIGISRTDFQALFEDGSFFELIDADAAAKMSNYGNNDDEDWRDVMFPMEMTLESGDPMSLTASIHRVRDEGSTFSYVLVLRRADKYGSF